MQKRKDSILALTDKDPGECKILVVLGDGERRGGTFIQNGILGNDGDVARGGVRNDGRDDDIVNGGHRVRNGSEGDFQIPCRERKSDCSEAEECEVAKHSVAVAVVDCR
jgi:hypothetical protein